MTSMNYDDLESTDTQSLIAEEAKTHNSRLQVELGKRYYRAEGVVFDANKTIDFYEKAANQGNDEAQVFLGNLNREMKDYEKAFDLFRKAASKNNPKAQYILGEMYERGEGVNQNFTEAHIMYEKAAENGNENAQEKLKRI